MDYIKILPRCEAYLLVNYDGDHFRLLTNLSDQLNWIRTFFHRAATAYSEGKTYRDAFGEEEWETAMETLSDVTIKVLGYAHTRNGITVYFEEDLPVYEDPELWNMYESTPEGMDQFLCYLNQLIYSLEHTPDLAMSITSPLMELVRSIGGDLEAEIEAELDREEFYQKIESI